METLDSAASFGLSARMNPRPASGTETVAPIIYDERMDFEGIIANWTPLTRALNAINRGMGLPDLYPFAIPAAVVEKLKFVHEVVRTSLVPRRAPAPPV